MLAATLALSAALTGPALAPPSVETSVTTWLVFDPTADNRLEIETPAALGGPSGTTLVGGVLATLHFDLLQVLLNQPLSVAVDVNEIRVAGASFAPLATLPSAETGTLCVTAAPGGAGSGTVTLPVPGRPHIEADMHTLTFLTSALGALFPGGIPLTAHISDDLQLDLRALLANRFAAGPVSVDTQAEGVIPSDILLLGGQRFRMHVKILNSLQPPEDPLLDECRTFLASRSG